MPGLGPGTGEWGGELTWSSKGSSMEALHHPLPSHKQQQQPASSPESRPQMGLDPGERGLAGEVGLTGQGGGNNGGLGGEGPTLGDLNSMPDGMLDLQGRGSCSKGGISAPRWVHLTSLLSIPPHTLIIRIIPSSMITSSSTTSSFVCLLISSGNQSG